MTEKVAIKRLQDHFEVHDDGRPTPFLNEAVSMAINALEKQIAIPHHHTRIDYIQDSVRVSVCPNCLGLIYTYKEEYPNFCTNCGQKISWEDSEV